MVPPTRLAEVVENMDAGADASVGRSTHAHHAAAEKRPPAAPSSATHRAAASTSTTSPSTSPGVHLDNVVERSIDLRTQTRKSSSTLTQSCSARGL